MSFMLSTIVDSNSPHSRENFPTNRSRAFARFAYTFSPHRC